MGKGGNIIETCSEGCGVSVEQLILSYRKNQWDCRTEGRLFNVDTSIVMDWLFRNGRGMEFRDGIIRCAGYRWIC